MKKKRVIVVAGTDITGVCMGWDLKPHIAFDGHYLPTNIERQFYSEYWPKGSYWPIDPATGKKLPIEDY